MFGLIALIMLGAGPTDPAPPKVPEAPVVRAPEVRAPEVKQPGDDKKAEAKGDAGVKLDERLADGDAKAGASEAKGVEKSEAKADAPPLPPSLTRRALCGEFIKTGKELAAARKRMDEDRKAVEADRSALEKLKAEIADARISLRAETERLEKLLAKRAEGGGEEPTTAAAPPAEKPKPPPVRPQELDSLARTMKSMKPEAAAALMARTEPSLAASVLKRMKPADAGAVMDKLKPDLAAELLSLMATIPSAPPKGGRL